MTGKKTCHNVYPTLHAVGCVLPLQRVALRQSPPTFSLICYPCPYRSLLPHNVISPMTFQSSNWSYALYLPLSASNSPSIIFLLGDVSSPFLFHICYILDYVCHFGSLPNDSVTDSVFWPTFSIFLSMAHWLVSCFFATAFVRENFGIHISLLARHTGWRPFF